MAKLWHHSSLEAWKFINQLVLIPLTETPASFGIHHHYNKALSIDHGHNEGEEILFTFILVVIINY